MMITEKFIQFVEIAKKLRKECPWDKEQDHASIRYNLIEEAYEVVEAIESNNIKELQRELGDLLLHVIFHSNIAEEKNEFTLEQVLDTITEKLIFRHPHIFGNTSVKDTDHIKRNWEKLKIEEGRESLLEGVPKHMPSLLRAQRITERASRAGFDWENVSDVWKKVEEEINELQDAIMHKEKEKAEKEFGDLLFSLVNYARFIDVHPENALRRSIEKFIARFQYIEKKLAEMGKDVPSSSLAEMDSLWNESKKNLSS